MGMVLVRIVSWVRAGLWLLLLAAVLASAGLLSGCSTIDKAGEAVAKRLENRVVVTVDCSEVHAISKWWLFSLGSRIAEPDARAIATRACRP